MTTAPNLACSAMADLWISCYRGCVPMLRSLVFNWSEDPMAWALADEYLLGDGFLVCPVLHASGVRHIYLPEGQ